jgi:hypothetical protein
MAWRYGLVLSWLVGASAIVPMRFNAPVFEPDRALDQVAWSAGDWSFAAMKRDDEAKPRFAEFAARCDDHVRLSVLHPNGPRVSVDILYENSAKDPEHLLTYNSTAPRLHEYAGAACHELVRIEAEHWTHRVAVESPNRKEAILYWYQQPGRRFTDTGRAKLAQAAGQLHFGRSDICLVRIHIEADTYVMVTKESRTLALHIAAQLEEWLEAGRLVME